MNELITTQFYEYLEKFLCELSKSSKKLKKVIEEKYSNVRDPKYINIIKNNIYIHKTDFLGKESELNTFFKNNSVELLEDINISNIWSKSDSDNKSAIVQYIKVFVFMFETSVEKVNNEENDSTDEDCSENNDNFEDILKKSLLDDDQNMKSFYDTLNKEDNTIVDLAKNIASELKNDNEGGLENMMNMFKDGQGLNGLVSKITSKLDNKIKSGELDQSQLLNDAQKMMSGNNNLFSNMFNNLNKAQNSSNNINTDSNNVEIVEEKSSPKKEKKKRTKKKN